MIATPLLTLRPPCLGDLAALHRELSEPRAMRYWSPAAHGSLDESRPAPDRIIHRYQ